MFGLTRFGGMNLPLKSYSFRVVCFTNSSVSQICLRSVLYALICVLGIVDCCVLFVAKSFLFLPFPSSYPRSSVLLNLLSFDATLPRCKLGKIKIPKLLHVRRVFVVTVVVVGVTL